ncbi:HNH endonuclease [Pseudomonas shirazensis]|uniref:HNH endonuclease n=1 Tax=Pseudomonas shirazensis TaxID=2745494 RepID=UPI003986EDA2
MADYYVIDAGAMAAALEKYKSKCHKTIKHRSRAFIALARLNRNALRRFDDLQSGVIAETPDLWKDFSNGKIGKSITGTEIKSAFRAFIASEQGNLCCYCQRWLLNNGNAKPIEHILPRESFKHYSFNFWNLAVACVDCNGLKSADVWVERDKLNVREYPAPSSFTEMYHPRFHRFNDHVRFVRVQTNEHNITLYRGITNQGRKLCHDLLQDIAAKEVLINGNPGMKASLATINQFEPEEGSGLEKALLELQEAFSAAAMKLVRPKD